MELEEIEMIKKAKQASYGTSLYRFPAELVESDEDYHAADNENDSDILDLDAMSCSELSSSEHSDYSFDSVDLFDGYKDFVLNCQKQDIKDAELATAKAAGGA